MNDCISNELVIGDLICETIRSKVFDARVCGQAVVVKFYNQELLLGWNKTYLEWEIEANTVLTQQVRRIAEFLGTKDHVSLGTGLVFRKYGKTLDQHVSEDGGMHATDPITICQNILEFTQSLHENEYVHFDIKPENVLIASDGIVVCDLGNARKTCLSVHRNCDTYYAGIVMHYINTGRYITEYVDITSCDISQGSNEGIARAVRDLCCGDHASPGAKIEMALQHLGSRS